MVLDTVIVPATISQSMAETAQQAETLLGTMFPSSAAVIDEVLRPCHEVTIRGTRGRRNVEAADIWNAPGRGNARQSLKPLRGPWARDLGTLRSVPPISSINRPSSCLPFDAPSSLKRCRDGQDHQPMSHPGPVKSRYHVLRLVCDHGVYAPSNGEDLDYLVGLAVRKIRSQPYRYPAGHIGAALVASIEMSMRVIGE